MDDLSLSRILALGEYDQDPVILSFNAGRSYAMRQVQMEQGDGVAIIRCQLERVEAYATFPLLCEQRYYEWLLDTGELDPMMEQEQLFDGPVTFVHRTIRGMYMTDAHLKVLPDGKVEIYEVSDTAALS